MIRNFQPIQQQQILTLQQQNEFYRRSNISLVRVVCCDHFVIVEKWFLCVFIYSMHDRKKKFYAHFFKISFWFCRVIEIELILQVINTVYHKKTARVNVQ